MGFTQKIDITFPWLRRILITVLINDDWCSIYMFLRYYFVPIGLNCFPNFLKHGREWKSNHKQLTDCQSYIFNASSLHLMTPLWHGWNIITVIWNINCHWYSSHSSCIYGFIFISCVYCLRYWKTGWSCKMIFNHTTKDALISIIIISQSSHCISGTLIEYNHTSHTCYMNSCSAINTLNAWSFATFFKSFCAPLWSLDMKNISALLVLYEKNPSVIEWFSLQRTGNSEL